MWGNGKRKSDNVDSVRENEGQGYRKRKETRMIKMGWGLVNDAGLKVIRSNQGGGPCHNFSVSKLCTKADLIAMGKHIFFPNQRSAIGHESEFQFDIQLGRGVSMGDDDTVESFYVASKNCYLRLYLACTRLSDLPRLTDCHSQMSSHVTDCHSHMSHQSITDCNNSRLSGLSDIECEQEIKDSVSNDAVYLYKEIKVKRIAIFEDLLKEFSSEFWLDCDMNMVYVSVVVELSDGETVVNEEKETTFKKCLTVFWNQFYDSCTKGVRCKVPTLRHDFNEHRWMAVARILVIGWVKLRYFPILLSPPFINACLEQEPSAADLTESFLLYLPPNESKLINDAMREFGSTDKDELHRVLSESLNAKVDTVNEENISEIIQRIAHQIHIQQPYFIIKHWKIELQSIALEITQESLQEIYKNLIPTSERLISVLRFDQLSSGRHESACGFLRRFIRDSDCEMLARLLHFITGSDMLTVDEIFVSFHEDLGFFKPQISLDSVFESDLVVSTAYNNYDDFQNELNKALNRI